MAEIPPDALATVMHALELCKRDFAFIGGCTMTDRPDLPLSPETSWTMDFSRQFAAIANAKAAIADAMAERKTQDWKGLLARLIESGLTQAQIAAECGVTQQSISALFCGKSADPAFSVGARLLELAEVATEGAALEQILAELRAIRAVLEKLRSFATATTGWSSP